jgi:hypothetical protein
MGSCTVADITVTVRSPDVLAVMRFVLWATHMICLVYQYGHLTQKATEINQTLVFIYIQRSLLKENFDFFFILVVCLSVFANDCPEIKD